MRGRFFLASAVLICLAGRATAQEVTGSITGRLLDESGHPADAGRITVSGADLLGTRDAISDRDGRPGR